MAQPFFHRFFHLVALVADVAGVQGFKLFGHAGQGLQLGLLGVAAGLIRQAGAEAHCACCQGLAQQILHGLQFWFGGGGLGVRHDGQAQVGVAHQSGHVDQWLQRFESVQITRHVFVQGNVA